jgi:hypothetical protein
MGGTGSAEPENLNKAIRKAPKDDSTKTKQNRVCQGSKLNEINSAGTGIY